MKKQFCVYSLIIMLFVVSQSVLIAQTLTDVPENITPAAVTCLSSDALHPVPGTEYEYSVNVPTPADGSFTYNWFVTQDASFISSSALTENIEAGDGTGDHIQATGTGYNDESTGTSSINITWKSFMHDSDTPVFLVIYVENTNACSTDNLEVYMIEPVHSFTLDIANLTVAGEAANDEYDGTCVSAVTSVGYNSVSGEVEFDYGENYLYFIVSAANFTNSWQPSFQVGGTGISGSRSVSAVDWAYPSDATSNENWHSMTDGGSGSWNTNAENVTAQDGNTVGGDGECIVVRMLIDNNQAETITSAEFTLAVDGVMYDPSSEDYSNNSYSDIHYDDCTDDDFDNDLVTQYLSPRPDINAVSPTTFIDSNRDE